MVYGFGRGSGGRGGAGLGFRGASPPWPYVGRGRGGLPRCGYFLSGAPVASTPFFRRGLAAPGYAPYSSPASKEEELSYLKQQAEAIKDELDEIESRMRDLESKE